MHPVTRAVCFALVELVIVVGLALWSRRRRQATVH